MAMYQMKKYSSLALAPHRHHQVSSYAPTLSTGEMNPVDPKPRLRWTPELHERFVDAVNQLGGADSEFIFSLILISLPFHQNVLTSLSRTP